MPSTPRGTTDRIDRCFRDPRRPCAISFIKAHFQKLSIMYVILLFPLAPVSVSINKSQAASRAPSPIFTAPTALLELTPAPTSVGASPKLEGVSVMPVISPTAMDGPLSYIGGKRRLAKQIAAIFPPHLTYCEVFLGGGQVFFRKEPSKVEVLNDLDGEVVNFFRCAQHHYEELCRCLRFALVSRQWFQVFESQNLATLTDIQRAARFFYLQKNAYAGLVHGRHYSAKVISTPGFNPARLPELLENTHRRLAKVQIESLPFQEFIPRFDRPSTLFFCDPPYWERKLYNFNFTEADQCRLAELLQSIKGKFLLTIDDIPQIRELYSKSNIREVELAYTSQREAGKRFHELIITNY